MKKSQFLHTAVLLSVLLLLKDSSLGTISPGFRTFLRDEYGGDVEKMIARDDLGDGGSFGGGDHVAGKATKRRPLIMVHGLTGRAGDLLPLKDYFVKKNYTEEEIYATTYGNGPAGAGQDGMKCEHIRQLRALIHAVRKYTNWPVDLTGYSMGVPICRKAVLGGTCVESGENLGEPLTPMVHIFIGVAGPNFGAGILCPSVVPNGPCDGTTGMSCDSKFLSDINLNSMDKRYEANNKIYTIYSNTDEVVGYKVCNGKSFTGTIPSQDFGVNITGFSHSMTILSTANLQYSLLNDNNRSLSVHITATNPPYPLEFN